MSSDLPAGAGARYSTRVQKVEFGSGDIKLKGKLIYPVTGKPVPGAVICHGFGTGFRTVEAPARMLAGKRVTMGTALGHGLWAFIKHYFFKVGFIDGWAGFVIAFGNFEGTFYRYAKRYEEAQNWPPPPSEPLRRETKP